MNTSIGFGLLNVVVVETRATALRVALDGLAKIEALVAKGVVIGGDPWGRGHCGLLCLVKKLDRHGETARFRVEVDRARAAAADFLVSTLGDAQLSVAVVGGPRDQ
jgi:hypothetical protein